MLNEDWIPPPEEPLPVLFPEPDVEVEAGGATEDEDAPFPPPALLPLPDFEVETGGVTADEEAPLLPPEFFPPPDFEVVVCIEVNLYNTNVIS